MDYPLSVVFRENKIVQVSSTAYYSWFPPTSQPTWSAFDNSVDAEEWVEYIDKYRGRTSIRKSEVRDTLHSLFECLKRRIHYVVGEARMRVAEHLDTQLRNDLAGGSTWNSDLTRTRHQFIILSCFARLMNSELLAQALSNFLSNGFDDIKRYERSEYLYSEWYPATKTVKGLIPTEMHYALVHRFPHKNHHTWDYDRGRATHRLALPVYEPRALSAPPRRRGQTPNIHLIACPHPIIARTPPMISPMHLLHANPFDEVDALHRKQDEMAFQLEDLQRDVDEAKEAGRWW